MAQLPNRYVPNADPKAEFEALRKQMEENVNEFSPEVEEADEDTRLLTREVVSFIESLGWQLRQPITKSAYTGYRSRIERLAASIPPNFEVSKGNFLRPTLAQTIYALLGYVVSDEKDEEESFIAFWEWLNYSNIPALYPLKTRFKNLYPAWNLD